ncbi:flagellar attachment zone protein 1 [Nilaparvata lugens]|uniref:flagellar attachment zone protein 1 n=1 Tax=Nilaparvata lugens TaxID=108931 RepID=UPI00193D7FD1|nr:flagellar attachment zone protein 1 [Nilaparvata lugens]
MATCAPNPERKLVADIHDFYRTPLITEKDLKNPTKAQITKFYSIVLSEFGVDVTQVVQTQMKQVDYLGGNIEMFSEHIPALNMVEAIKCLQIPGFQDFCVMHLINPMPKSTFKYIRLMMNFLLFADHSLASLRQVFRRVADARIKRDNLLEARNKFKEDISQIAKQIKAEESRPSNIDSQIGKRIASLSELNEEKEKWQGQCDRVKTELTKITEVRDKQYNETQMIENDLKEFQKRLKVHKNVHNTSTGFSQHLSLETLKMKASNLKEQKSELQQQLTTRQVELDFKLKFQSEYPFLKSKLEEVVDLLQRKRLVTNEQAQLAQELSTIEDNVKLLESQTTNSTYELDKSEEHLNGLRLKWSLEESSLKEALNENHCKKLSVHKKYNELMAKRVELDNELESLDKKIKENENKFQVIIDKCNEYYEADRLKLKEYKKKVLLEKLESGNLTAENMKSSISNQTHVD